MGDMGYEGLKGLSLKELWVLFPIIIKEHNVYYKDWYEIERGNILKFLGDDVVKRISHIGSSAVAGLVSKPTVDILLELDNSVSVDFIIKKISENRWIKMSFQDSPYVQVSFNKGYTPQGFAEKVFHLHVRFYDDWDELYFRDYLIDNKVVRDEYSKLKLDLVKKFKNDRDAYTNAKSDFIKKYSKMARLEYGDRYSVL